MQAWARSGPHVWVTATRPKEEGGRVAPRARSSEAWARGWPTRLGCSRNYRHLAQEGGGPRPAVPTQTGPSWDDIHPLSGRREMGCLPKKAGPNNFKEKKFSMWRPAPARGSLQLLCCWSLVLEVEQTTVKQQEPRGTDGWIPLQPRQLSDGLAVRSTTNGLDVRLQSRKDGCCCKHSKADHASNATDTASLRSSQPLNCFFSFQFNNFLSFSDKKF